MKDPKSDLFSWFPNLRIRIGNLSWIDKEFISNGKIIDGDFDTGASSVFLSYEYLLEEGIITPITSWGYYAISSTNFFAISKKLNISLLSSTGESNPVEIPCLIIRDFSSSPLAKTHKDRIALIGRNILQYYSSVTFEFDMDKKETNVIFQDWKSFEREVANLYRLLGLQVKRNISLSGNQIDVFLSENTTSGKTLSTIVECKFYKKPVGVKEIKEFSYVFEFSKANNLADHAILVSSSGFTKDGSLVAKTAGIELLEIEDLRVRVGIRKEDKYKIYNTPEEASNGIQNAETDVKTAFVIMPFMDEYKDIFMLGFREVLSNYGYVCIRVDEVQFNDRILDKIKSLIEEADLIVAELTEHNPNVYYELGMAHALNKNVVMCTKKISNAPLDVRGFNHIIYNDIVELREKLSKRLDNIIPDINLNEQG